MAALKQLSQVVQCTSCDTETVRNVISLSLTLAYSAEIHSNLVHAGLIESLTMPDLIPQDREEQEVLFP